MRSALLSVKGVTNATVTLKDHQAVVSYDPAQCTADDMIKAVRNAGGPAYSRRFGAVVKKVKRP